MTRRFPRRSFLSGAASAAALPLLSCGEEASSGELSEHIDTVVVLMMENRSFDHYMGSLSLLEGRTDIDGLQAGMSNPDPDGKPVLIHRADASCIADPPHAWRSSRTQLAEGTNSGFVRAHAAAEGRAEMHRVMGYLTRAELPTYYAFADHFGLATRWHASLLTSTWPNRIYALAGQNGGYQGNQLDGDYGFANIFDRLEQQGVSWSRYFGNLSFSWVFPQNYPEATARNHERFFADAAAGELPRVSFLEPVYGRNDDHPPEHPLAGQVFVQSVYEALRTSPQWERCLFIVTYDEHGGFYDHVVPGKAPDARAEMGFDQLGFRVPGFVVGPYVKPGYASAQLFDHTSILATLQRLFGIWPLTERDSAAHDLLELVDLARAKEGRARPGPALPTIVANEAELYAPECRYDFGFLLPRALTGQPELERLAERPGFELRKRTDEGYEQLLRLAERQGTLRRRSH